MTAPTPEQMRKAAWDSDALTAAFLYRLADRMEANTAPQEDRALAARARREGWHDIDGNETHR